MIFKINNKEFIIRDSNNEDYEFVINLLEENMYELFMKHWGMWNPEPFKKNFFKTKFKIIKHKDEKIGFYDLAFKKDFAYLHDIQIIKSMQKKGIGTFLMNLMEKETKKYGLKKIRLKTFEDNYARKFYLKIGYKQVKVERTSMILEKVL